MEEKNKTEKPIPSMSKPIKIIPNPYKEIAGFENGKHQFGFKACRKWLKTWGKKLTGRSFVCILRIRNCFTV